MSPDRHDRVLEVLGSRYALRGVASEREASVPETKNKVLTFEKSQVLGPKLQCCSLPEFIHPLLGI